MAWENNRPDHVPTKVRDACLKRDNNRCTATLRTGGRCTETTRLEAAHITQWQPGERTTVDIVRTLCHWHHNRITQREAAEARAKAQQHRPSSSHPRETHPALR